MKTTLSLALLTLALLRAPEARAVVGGAGLDPRHEKEFKPVLGLALGNLLCTGTLIGATRLITASHCLTFADIAERQPEICLSDDAGAALGCLEPEDYSVAMPVATKIQPIFFNDKIYLIHDPDLAVITLKAQSAPGKLLAQFPKATIAAAGEAATGPFFIVGQGCTDFSTLAGKGVFHFGAVIPQALPGDGSHFYATYDPQGAGAAACAGDSGGPLLRENQDGSIALLGVTSQEGSLPSPGNGQASTQFGSLLDAPVAQWLEDFGN